MKGFIRQVTQRHATEKFLRNSLCISVIGFSLFPKQYFTWISVQVIWYGNRVWEQFVPHGFHARQISTKYKPCHVIKTYLMKYRGYTVWGLYNQIDSLCTLLGFPAIFYICSGIQTWIKTCKFKCLSVKYSSRRLQRKILGTTG